MGQSKAQSCPRQPWAPATRPGQSGGAISVSWLMRPEWLGPRSINLSIKACALTEWENLCGRSGFLHASLSHFHALIDKGPLAASLGRASQAWTVLPLVRRGRQEGGGRPAERETTGSDLFSRSSPSGACAASCARTLNRPVDKRLKRLVARY